MNRAKAFRFTVPAAVALANGGRLGFGYWLDYHTH